MSLTVKHRNNGLTVKHLAVPERLRYLDALDDPVYIYVVKARNEDTDIMITPQASIDPCEVWRSDYWDVCVVFKATLREVMHTPLALLMTAERVVKVIPMNDDHETEARWATMDDKAFDGQTLPTAAKVVDESGRPKTCEKMDEKIGLDEGYWPAGAESVGMEEGYGNWELAGFSRTAELAG